MLQVLNGVKLALRKKEQRHKFTTAQRAMFGAR